MTQPEAPDGGAPIRVVVADDHPMWLDAVARDLAQEGFDVVATAADGPSAVNRTRATSPDVLVLDLNMPGLTGPQVCRALADAGVSTRVLVLSASAEAPDVLESIKAGALGYLLKSARREEVVAAVRSTAAGEAVFTPSLAGLVLGEFRRLANGPAEEPAEVPELTPRETQVLRLVAMGMSYKQIAAELGLSHRTVQNHVQNTLTKLQLHNRVQLVRFAISRGLDGVDPTLDPTQDQA